MSARQRGACVLIAAVLGTVMAGCRDEEGQSSDPERACELLAARRPGPDVQEPPDLTGPPELPGQSLADLLGETRFDRSTHAVVYLDAARADELEQYADDLAARPGVEVSALFDQDKTFAEFRRMFAEHEQLIESVTPDLLPPSVRVSASSDDALEGLVAWAEGDTRTDEVMDVREWARGAFPNIARQFDRPLERLVEITTGELREAFVVVQEADDQLTLDQAVAVYDTVDRFLEDECGP